MFAASFPERVSALIVVNAGAKYRAAEDFPGGVSREQGEFLARAIEEGWGRETLIRFAISSLADDERSVRWLAKYLRSCMSPRGANAQFRYLLELDVRHVLPAIHVPTLVIHRAAHP